MTRHGRRVGQAAAGRTCSCPCR